MALGRSKCHIFKIVYPSGASILPNLLRLCAYPDFKRFFTFLGMDGPRQSTQAQGTDLEGHTFTDGGKGRASIWELKGLIYMRILIDIFGLIWKT